MSNRIILTYYHTYDMENEWKSELMAKYKNEKYIKVWNLINKCDKSNSRSPNCLNYNQTTIFIISNHHIHCLLHYKGKTNEKLLQCIHSFGHAWVSISSIMTKYLRDRFENILYRRIMSDNPSSSHHLLSKSLTQDSKFRGVVKCTWTLVGRVKVLSLVWLDEVLR